MRTLVFILVAVTVGCDSGSDAQELENLVSVASNGFTSVNIQTASDVIEVGGQRQPTLTATTDDAGSATVDVTTSAFWSGNNDEVATVTPDGLVTGVADGVMIVTAELGPLSDSIELTVSSAPLTQIVIQPVSAMVDECSNFVFTANGIFSDGERDITQTVEWVATDGGLFDDSDDAGLLRTDNSGVVTVTATRDGIQSVPVAVTVLDNLDEITILEPTETLSLNNSVDYSAIATYNNSADSVDITDNSVWSFSDASFGTVDNDLPDRGLVNATRTGQTTLNAVCGGETGLLDIQAGDATTVTELFFGRSSPFVVALNMAMTFQLQVFTRFEDGTNIEVTEDAEWSIVTSNNPLFTVSNVIGSRGEVFISGVGNLLIEVSFTDEDTDGNPTFFQRFEIVSN